MRWEEKKMIRYIRNKERIERGVSIKE